MVHRSGLSGRISNLCGSMKSRGGGGGVGVGGGYLISNMPGCVCSNVLGRHQNSLPLTTNLSQKLTQPSKGISYPVGDLHRRFTEQTLPSTCTLHGNPIPPTDGTNGLL